jgi:hypothetical protein
LVRTEKMQPFWGAHAPPRVGFGALAETFIARISGAIKEEIETESFGKLALARAPMPAREARALPGIAQSPVPLGVTFLCFRF